MGVGFVVHMVLHVLVPVAVAWLFYRDQFRPAALVLLAGLAIDIDHLLAVPILDPDRCSVGFHLLHQYWAIPAYLALAVLPKTRLVGLGLVIHLALDLLDCYL